MAKKRAASSAAQNPVKKRKVQRDKNIIPIPVADEDNVAISDQDEELLDTYATHAAFLTNLDTKAISRSKQETERLHRLNKPIRKRVEDDDLPSIDSDDEDEESGGEDTTSSIGSDGEMPYETIPRKRRPSWNEEERNGVQRLPVKLADGRILNTGRKEMPKPPEPPSSEESDPGSDSGFDEDTSPPPARQDVAIGARFGRASVTEVIGTSSRKKRVQLAKEQIADICQDIISDPENSIGLLRRLHTFCLPRLKTPDLPEPIQNDVIIQKLSFLSQLAVFKDIVPGYRIRELTDKEKSENISQMVARTRDWEQGLVSVYHSYLRSLESALKGRGELADTALQCICTLAVDLVHFNFRANLFACIVSYLSKKSWQKSSDLCLNTLIKIFKSDNTGEPSLEIVRLLNRMVKEKKFAVHPSVLTCLLYLRLKSELGVRSSDSKADSQEKPKQLSKGKAAQKRAQGKRTNTPHLSKKVAKALKEKKEIDKEMREAEAEVDKEQRATTHTETLKLIFVLYFRILKHPEPTPLLPAALRGIAKYAHLVNIDFFKDLMQVIKGLIAREEQDESHLTVESMTRRLLCIISAFELLSGQGEALNIDLTDFITSLYTLILPISTIIPSHPQPSPSSPSAAGINTSDDDIYNTFFHALTLAFPPTAHPAPTTRSAAFIKRLMTASLQFPPPITLRTLDFIRCLVCKDTKLEILVEEGGVAGGGGAGGGVQGFYRGDIDDPQVCGALGARIWESSFLLGSRVYLDTRVEDMTTNVVAQLQPSS